MNIIEAINTGRKVIIPLNDFMSLIIKEVKKNKEYIVEHYETFSGNPTISVRHFKHLEGNQYTKNVKSYYASNLDEPFEEDSVIIETGNIYRYITLTPSTTTNKQFLNQPYTLC